MTNNSYGLINNSSKNYTIFNKFYNSRKYYLNRYIDLEMIFLKLFLFLKLFSFCSTLDIIFFKMAMVVILKNHNL